MWIKYGVTSFLRCQIFEEDDAFFFNRKRSKTTQRDGEVVLLKKPFNPQEHLSAALTGRWSYVDRVLITLFDMWLQSTENSRRCFWTIFKSERKQWRYWKQLPPWNWINWPYQNYTHYLLVSYQIFPPDNRSICCYIGKRMPLFLYRSSSRVALQLRLLLWRLLWDGHGMCWYAGKMCYVVGIAICRAERRICIGLRQVLLLWYW